MLKNRGERKMKMLSGVLVFLSLVVMIMGDFEWAIFAILVAIWTIISGE